ncbi:hypothetical protein AM1_A0331 (plasmid) [Acaryochloris marina MBIC11017]|uniref:Uncharacterized protein n=1 Tax=Acaryochloris marina (strain MBIC 11017) TaxID=329726 RepID=A8ZKY1_ACAM1|nr:hypothetical protein AM1_A0331 [Acaryochloris marina MBIC11017]
MLRKNRLFIRLIAWKHKIYKHQSNYFVVVVNSEATVNTNHS